MELASKSTSFFYLIIVISWWLTSCGSQPQPVPIGWRKLAPQNQPPPIAGGAIAYNSTTKTAILFGGTSDIEWSDETWLWNGSSWIQQNPIHRPAARDRHAMAYDEKRNQVVLFAGSQNQTLFDDTWEWSGDKWQLMEPEHKPPARCCHAMAYDRLRGKVVLYGGWDSITNSFLADTWEWDGSDWKEVTCCQTPAASGHTMGGYTAQNELIAVFTAEQGSWVWSGQAWRKLEDSNPPSRANGGLAQDEKHQVAVFFGGKRDGNLRNDTWIFYKEAWAELNLPISPTPRFAHMIFYDQKRQKIILFGGVGENDTRLSDTWELTLPDDLSSPSGN
jgi:hypothetical protein